jgi:hypothetical protein
VEWPADVLESTAAYRIIWRLVPRTAPAPAGRLLRSPAVSSPSRSNCGWALGE